MRIDQALLADTILFRTPGWARVGLTAPDDRLRDDAAQELARVILDEIDAPHSAANPDQLALAL